MDSAKKVLDRVLYWITVVLFALLVVVVVWQIFSRQVLHDPSTWTEEGARMTFVWLGLFASAFVFGERGHIAVEFVVRKLPVGGERVVSVLVQLVVLAFAVIVLVWGGWRASQNAWLQNLSALPFTLGQMYLALPISGALIAFYSLYYIQAVARNTQLPYGDHSDEDELVPATTVEPEPRGLDEVDSILLDPDETERRGDDPAGPKTEA
ncbi:TRAP transporter small permease [uncultured Georgenia sp.]|uniref:TRAP transporter small permease n=1 Tax=uncultured Georgenia sp. TaxID=378209 RepID=UPI00262CEF65|nr:TRAP transporter small permease [uncultured Georgenia sp.]HLV03843.1 TRAP transporter small permease [Actinomycetaceae bacterium]